MSGGPRTGRPRTWVLVALVVTLWGQAGVAQEAPAAPKEPDWGQIRKGPFDSDRDSVEQWVERRVERLFSADDAFADGPVFYGDMTKHYLASDATTGFRDGLAGIVANAFADRYKPGTSNSIPVVFVLTVLNVYGHPAAFDSYQRALSDSVPGVRLLAARGLTAIRGKISDEQWTALLPGVQKAAIAETDPVVLARLFRLLSAEGGRRAEEAVPVVFAVLDARFQRFEQENQLPTLADADLVVWLGQRFPTIANPQTQNEITLRTARLLADAVHLYLLLNPPPQALAFKQGESIDQLEDRLKRLFGLDLNRQVIGINLGQPAESGNSETTEDQKRKIVESQNRKIKAFFNGLTTSLGADQRRIETVERVIRAAETALVVMVNRRIPDKQQVQVARAMLAGGATRGDEMRAACNNWVGIPQDRDFSGLLNKAPFNLERGLNIQRAIPKAGSGAR